MMKAIQLARPLKRREFLKSLGVGVGAVALGGPQWAFAQKGKNIIVAAASPARSIFNLPQYYASEKILKPEMGISIVDKTFRGFIPSFAALVKGEVNYSYQTFPSLTRAIKEKFPAKGFLGLAQQFVFFMVALPEIKTLDDLVSRIKAKAKSGKKLKFALHSPSSMSRITMNMILRDKGVDPKRELEVVYLAGTPKRLAALKAKTVEATVIFVSRSIENEMRGAINILAKMSDLAPQQTASLWVATEETLSKRAKEVQIFTNAMVRAYRDMYKLDIDKLAEFATTQKPWRKFNPKKAVRETIKAAREMKLWPVNGGITKENITTAQKFLVETKFMKPENILPIDQLVTTKFRDQALKELGPA